MRCRDLELIKKKYGGVRTWLAECKWTPMWSGEKMYHHLSLGKSKIDGPTGFVWVELQNGDGYYLHPFKKVSRPDVGVSRDLLIRGLYTERLHEFLLSHWALPLKEAAAEFFGNDVIFPDE